MGNYEYMSLKDSVMNHIFGFECLKSELDIAKYFPDIVEDEKNIYVNNTIPRLIAFSRYLEEKYHAVMAYACKCEIARFRKFKLSREAVEEKIEGIVENKINHTDEHERKIFSSIIQCYQDENAYNEEYIKRLKEYWRQSLYFRIEVFFYIDKLIEFMGNDNNLGNDESNFVFPYWNLYLKTDLMDCMYDEYNKFTYNQFIKAENTFFNYLKDKYGKEFEEYLNVLPINQNEQSQINEEQLKGEAYYYTKKIVICHLGKLEFSAFKMLCEELLNIQLGSDFDAGLQYIYKPKRNFRISNEYIIYMTNDIKDVWEISQDKDYFGCVITAERNKKRAITSKQIPQSVIIIYPLTESKEIQGKTVLERISSNIIKLGTVKEELSKYIKKWIMDNAYEKICDWVARYLRITIWGEDGDTFVIAPIKQDNGEILVETTYDHFINKHFSRDFSLIAFREELHYDDELDNFSLILAYTIQYYYDLSVEYIDFEPFHSVENALFGNSSEHIMQIENVNKKYSDQEVEEIKNKIFSKLKDIYNSGTEIEVISWADKMLDKLLSRVSEREKEIKKIKKSLKDKSFNVDLFISPPNEKQRRYEDHRRRNTVSLFMIGWLALNGNKITKDELNENRRPYEDDLLKLENSVTGRKEKKRLFLSPEERAHVQLKDFIEVFTTPHTKQKKKRITNKESEKKKQEGEQKK